MTNRPDPYDTRTLLTWLAAQQRRVLGILDGLDEEDLLRPVLPSGWSCAGMVRHLTVGTTFWFAEVMAGRPVDHRDDPDDDFTVPDGMPASVVLRRYREQVRETAGLVSGLPPHTPPACWPEGLFGDWRLDDLAEVLLHVLVETACHAGHLDAARELIDGRTWDYARGRLSEPA
jgi:hypothetical protein